MFFASAYLKALLCLLLAFPFNLNLSELFQSESAKELQRLQSGAESALKKENLPLAKEAYAEIIKRIEPTDGSGTLQKVDWPTYVDTYLRYGEILLTLKEEELGMRLLNGLLAARPPKNFIPKIQLLLARFLAASARPIEAYRLMREAQSMLPETEWQGGDRSFFHALEFSLEEQTHTRLIKGSALMKGGYYKEAAKVYGKLYESIEKGALAGKFLEKSEELALTASLLLRLGECAYFLGDMPRALRLISKPPFREMQEKLSDQMRARLFFSRGLYPFRTGPRC